MSNRIERCVHFLPMGLCQVKGCPHWDTHGMSYAGKAKLKQGRKCNRCRLRKPGVVKRSGDIWYCDDCWEWLGDNSGGFMARFDSRSMP
jgi:hypothetical protein